MKKYYLFLGIFLLLAAGAFLYIRYDRSAGDGAERPAGDIGVKPAPIAPLPLTDEEKTKEVEDYLREQISALSPRAAVLGGTFYVTAVRFPEPNKAVVDYEDGHIALRGQAVYAVTGDGMVTISDFTVVEENPAPAPAPIGGETAEHGCLGPAGYAWLEEVGACARGWELGAALRPAAKAAAAYIGPSKGLTIILVESDETAGRYFVTLEKGESSPKTRVKVEVMDGQVVGEPEEIGPIGSGGDMDGPACLSAGGNWNECSSRCQLDNQGKEGVACTMMCEQLCECGGLAGFACPNGYECTIKATIPDALGYCEKKK